MLYLLELTHKPRQRHKFPRNWLVATPTKLVSLTEQGPYWFQELRNNKEIVDLVMTNLTTNEISQYN